MVRRRILLFSLAVGLLLAISACTSVPSAAPAEIVAAKELKAPEGKARIYIFRKEGMMSSLGGGTTINTFATLDGEMLGALTSTSYAMVEVEPGPHSAGGTVRINRPPDEITFHAESGGVYFFRIRIGLYSATDVTPLSEAQAKAFLQDDRYTMIQSL